MAPGLVKLYKSRIWLWLMAPGLVKLYTPVSLRSAMVRDTGSISVRMVMELGMFTTRRYLQILVMKLRPLRSSEMGMRTRRMHTLLYVLASFSTIALVYE